MSLTQTSTAQAVSLPVIDRLLDKLLPLGNVSRENSAQPETTQSAASESLTAEQPAQPVATPLTSSPQPSQAIIPAATPLEPAAILPAVQLVNPGNAAWRNTEHDVLRERIEGAAAMYRQEKLLPSQTCAQFFGICWYVVAPIGVVVTAGAYLLVIRNKHSRTAWFQD